MTTLDERALEAAESVCADLYGNPPRPEARDDSFIVEAELIVRAYLNALPPAVNAWARPGIFEANGGFEVHRDYRLFDGNQIVAVEIREIRA